MAERIKDPEPQAEIKEAAEAKNLEQEISLLNVPANFQKKIISLGATLEIPQRKISDLRYTKLANTKSYSSEISAAAFSSKPEKALEVLQYLGYTVELNKQGKSFTLSRKAGENSLPKRMARLRTDGKTFLFTVKGPDNKQSKVKTMGEYEVGLTGQGLNSLKSFFEQSGHTLDSDVDKNRTTLRLPANVFNGKEALMVEEDEFLMPKGMEPFRRAELEGQEADILKALEFLKQQGIFTGQTSTKGQSSILRERLNLADKAHPLILKFPK